MIILLKPYDSVFFLTAILRHITARKGGRKSFDVPIRCRLFGLTATYILRIGAISRLEKKHNAWRGGGGV